MLNLRSITSSNAALAATTPVVPDPGVANTAPANAVTAAAPMTADTNCLLAICAPSLTLGIRSSEPTTPVMRPQDPGGNLANLWLLALDQTTAGRRTLQARPRYNPLN